MMAHSSGSRAGPRPAARRTRPVRPSGSGLLAESAQPDPGPRDLTPRGAHVTIRKIPESPRRRIGRADMILHVTTALLALTLLVALLWLR